jgi:hypothetical protein
MNEVIELFAYITCPCGFKAQVLKYDEDGNPVDWDQEATQALFDAHYAECSENPDNKK